jgi:putative hydrolase of the HAD superfamily
MERDMKDQKNQFLIDFIRNQTHALKVIASHMEPMIPVSNKVPVKVVLFDVYGTLFISGSGDIGSIKHVAEQERDINELLLEYNINQSAQHIRQKFIIAVKAEHRQLHAKGIDYPEVRYEEIWAKVLAIEASEKIKRFAVAYELITNPVYPMPHIHQCFEALRSKGITMGIISNAQFFTPLLFPALLGNNLENLGFDSRLLNFSYTCSYAKPSVFMFFKIKEILRAMGVFPENVLFVGNDMLKDIYPALQAGFRAVLFAGDQRSLRLREEDFRCTDILPYAVITDLEQLIKLV